MGKYKQWLHHQEIGRRLRDQISTLEQERARVQQMAPQHMTNLPELNNPVIAALLHYTQQGNQLSDVDVIQAAMPDIGPRVQSDPDIRQPVTSLATASSLPTVTPVSTEHAHVVPVVAAPVADETVVASLLARAQQMPAGPLGALSALSQPVEYTDSGAAAPVGQVAVGTSHAAESVNGWWQRQRADDE